MIVREADVFFRELKIAEEREKEIRIVWQECEAGRLAWDMDGVYSLVTPLPRRAVLDTTKEFQEDVAAAPEEDERAAESSSDASTDEDGDTQSGGDDGGDEAHGPGLSSRAAALSNDHASLLAAHASKVVKM